MRIVKKLGNNKHLSKIFDEVLSKTWYRLFVERLEFILSNSHGFELDGRTAKIFFDKNDECLKNNDARIMRAIIAHQFFHIIMRLRGISSKHHLVEDVIVNREMVKHGFKDDIFYYMYNWLIKKKHVSNFEDYLMLHVPWLSFHTIDEHTKRFLRNLINHINFPKSFHEKSKRIIKKFKSSVIDEKTIKKLERYLS